MDALIARLLNPLMSRLNGWKTILGAALLLGTLIAKKLGVTDPDVLNGLWYAGEVVFGVGLVHKGAKATLSDSLD